jgi:deoxycytidylate deaminase
VGLVSYNGKVARFMSLAKNVARQSEFSDYRHGAILVKGGSIISTSPNKDSFCSFGARFRNSQNQPGRATRHAEIGAILGLDRSITDGATLYVARIGKADEFRMSKPCQMCESTLRHVGIKRVIYTINNKEVGDYKL